MKKIVLFANSSRSEDVYEVTVNFKDGYLKIECECEAAKRGRMCRHLLSLITGETSKIFDESINNNDAIKAISIGLNDSGTLKKYKKYMKLKSSIDGAISQLLNSEISQEGIISKLKLELDNIDK